MKKILRIFVFAALLLASLGVWARPVSVDQARQVAESFLRGMGCRNASSLVDRSAELPFHQFYLFTAEQGGFILVSADDCVLPILGYSTTNNFDVKGMPAHVADWLGGYEEQIAYFVRQDERRRSSGLQCGDDSENIVALQWELLLAGEMLEPTNTNSVSPLLTTTWDQSPYYNNLCPVDYDNYSGHAYAGCTAIATAQVMKYWDHPSVGYGSMTYYHDTYGSLSANFGSTTYQWNSMPNALSSSSTSSQINAVATLVYHVGVAVNMNYGPNGSGARTISFGDLVQPSAENALKYNFKYKSSLHAIHRSDYAPEVFAGILCTELDNSRPIIFTGYDVDAGHAFVLDGYNYYGDFHVNWGWGGYCDGYYAMGALNPSTGGSGGNTSGTYNINNSAIIGVEPNDSFSTTGTTSVSVTSSPSSYGSATGSGYYSFGSTVNLTAYANEGCRFSHWNDGYRYNPCGFLATGGSYSFTAIFEHLSGDTLGYVSSNTMLTSFGTGTTGSNVYWGIRLPASVLTSGHDLKKVQMYVAYAGTYTTNIYVGSTSSTPVASQTFTATTADEETWKTVTLTTPVTVTGNQDIYITFENYGVAYPAALSYDCGNDDGLLWDSSFGSIHSSWNYTWMIRGIFGSSIPTGNTLSYCEDNPFETNIGAGGNLYWGIKIPGSWQMGHNYLSSVQLYVVEPGTYDLILAQGGTNAPSTTIPIQSVSFSSNDVNQWHTIPIATTYMLDSSQPLWVAFHNTDATYPAAACLPNTDANSSWCSSDGTTWGSLYTLSGGELDYSWMIKCIVSDALPEPSVTISGDTYFQTFTSKTFSAQYNRTNATYVWTLQGATPSYATGATATAYWSQAGIYDVVVAATSGGVTARDTLQVEVYAPCLAITSFPYTMGFEATDDLSCWNFVDADGDGYGWTTTNIDEGVAFEGLNGGTAIGSNSYNNTSYALTPDNWLISPAITLPSGTTPTLTWYAKSYSANFAEEFYSVYISTTGNSPANFSTLLYMGTSTGTWIRPYADLSAYAGQTVYIAFRHYNCTDQWALLLDDVTIDNNVPQYYTVAANANNSSYGSVTGSGTYSEGSQVSLYATASTDCRFAYWADGNADNPRTFAVTGNVSHTAYFEHLSGDTLRYDNGIHLSNLGRSSGSMSWAVRFNPTVMYGYSTLQKVQFLDVASGSYTISIHRGGTTAPGTLVTSQPVSLSGSGSMVTFDLNNPVSLNTSDPIWIVVDYSGTGYPAAYATSSGNTDGGWVSLDGSSWSDISEYGYPNTWILRGIMQATPNTYTITAVANNPSYGTVTGSGTYAQGSTVTLTATPNAGYQFTNWQDGNTNATRTITVSGNATYTAYFTATADPCSAITSFPYTMGFESTDDLSCWNFVDADGDGYGWDYNTFSNNNQSHTGSGVIGSASFINDIGALTPDNWMITPQMQLPANAQFNLSWWVKAVDANYCAENYTVYVSTTGNQPADFTTVLFNGTVESASYVRKNIDLSAYAGQNIYIAFRHHNITDMYWMLIDDITIDNNVPQYYTVTANANNSSYGSVSGDGTYLEGSSVTLYATASADCRFAYWNDGNADNPRTFAVTGNVSHTAYFEHLSGDTLRYDNGIHLSSLGRGGSMSWAVRFNPTVMYGYSTLQKVQFLDVASGSYTIRIHRGGSTAPGTLVTSQPVSLSGSGSMVTFDLNNPVSLNTSDPIWIVVDYSGTGYPAAYAASSGNPDGGWVSLDGSTWSNISEYGYPNTWILRGIMQAAPNTYTITAVANNPSYGIVTGSGTYAQGSTVTLTATPNAGYQFTNWNDGNTNATRTITVSGNATYTAYFQPIPRYDVTIACMGTGSGEVERADSPGSNICGTVDQVYEGFVASYKFLPSQGSELTHLYVNNVDRINEVQTSSSASSSSYSLWSFTPTSNTTIYSVFDLRNFTVTAAASNPTQGSVTGSGVYSYGSSVVLTAQPVTGHHFAYWSITTATGTTTSFQNPYVGTITSDMSATAYFAPDSYQITVTANDPTRGVVSGSGQYTYLETVTATATPYNGYYFAGWSNGTSYNPYTFPATQDLTLQALFLPEIDTTTYLVSAVANDPTMGSVTGAGTYASGQQVTISAQPSVGHHFVYWEISEGSLGNSYTSTQNPYVFTVEGVMEFRAIFAIDTFEIMVSPNDPLRGTVSGSGQYTYMETVTAIATPYSGYYFAGWSNGTNYNPYSFPATQDLVLQALFLPESDTTTYVVNAVANDPTMGSVTGAGTYAGGQQATITAQPSEGHHFVYWEISDGNLGDSYTSTQNPYIFTVEGFTEFRAIFAIDTFEITVSPNDPLRGTVSGSGQYTYMEAVTVIATPYSGYYFACWDNGSTQNPYMFQAIGNDTLVALFLPDGDATTYQITVSVNDSTMGEATGGGTYQQGETVTLSATAYEGYRFDNWSDGSTENPRTVVVTENKTYVAYFSSLTGIAEVRSVAVALYPNPTKGKIHVDADVVERIQIYDQVGRLIGVYEHTNEVDISGFASGIYTLRIQMSLGEDIKKVIKVDF